VRLDVDDRRAVDRFGFLPVSAAVLYEWMRLRSRGEIVDAGKNVKTLRNQGDFAEGAENGKRMAEAFVTLAVVPKP